jgi:uncharacterized protein YkwD
MRKLPVFSLFALFACGTACVAEGGPAARTLVAPQASFAEQLAELVNRERASCSARGCPLPPLKLVATLSAVAFSHSASMAQADYFSHCDFATGLDPFERLQAAGYRFRFAAENLAAGSATPVRTMEQWMSSREHRANVLDRDARELGVGYFRQDGDVADVRWDGNGDCDCTDRGETCRGQALTHYWTQLFGAREERYPLIIAGERAATASAEVELYRHAPADATEMRLRNDGEPWSAWRAFAAQSDWTLAPGDGRRTVYSEVRSGSLVLRACDTILRAGSGAPAADREIVACDGDGGFRDTAP